MTATIVSKATGETQEVAVDGPIELDGASVVTLQLDRDQVGSIERTGETGRDLALVTQDGNRIVINNIYPEDDDETSDLVLQDEDGALWWLQADQATGEWAFVADPGTAAVAAGPEAVSATTDYCDAGPIAAGVAAAALLVSRGGRGAGTGAIP